MKKFYKKLPRIITIAILLLSGITSEALAQAFCYNCNGTSGVCAIPNTETNPNLDVLCGDLNVALVLDESGSVSGNEEDVRAAVLSFMNNFRCTGAKISILEFRESARYVQQTPRLVDDGFISDINNYFDANSSYNNTTYNPQGTTNWQSAFQLVDDLVNAPDLVVMFTDGNPTSYTDFYDQSDRCGDGLSTQQPEIVNAIKLVNKIKLEDSRIFVSGVGNTTGFESNIQKITGTQEYFTGDDITQADYNLSNNFDIFVSDLKIYSDSICPTVISCSSFDVRSDGLRVSLNNSMIQDNTPITLTWVNQDDSSNDGNYTTNSLTSNTGLQEIVVVTAPGTNWHPGNYLLTVNALSSAQGCSLETFCLAAMNHYTLPVEMNYFNVTLDGNTANLNWQTLSENNNSHFEIERKIGNNGIFEKIGNVLGNGNSFSTIDYSFEDKYLKAGDFYYRLKQYDYDGNFEYSEIKSVTIAKEIQAQVFPNPTTDFVTVLLPTDEEFEVSIFNVQGEIMCVQPTYKNGERISLNGLPKGTYLIRLTNSKMTENLKVFVQ